MNEFEVPAERVRAARWVADLSGVAVANAVGDVRLGGLTALDDRLVLNFTLVLPRPFRDADETRSAQFRATLTDDLGTTFQDLGGGFETEHLRCAGFREFAPGPRVEARVLTLVIAPRDRPELTSQVTIHLPARTRA